MTEKEQIDQLYTSGKAWLDRARSEYSISYASMIGVLMMLVGELQKEINDKKK